MSNFLNSGIKRAQRATAKMQIMPPLVTEKDKVVAAAIEAARICPAAHSKEKSLDFLKGDRSIAYLATEQP